MTSATALPSGSETSPVSPNNRVSAVQAAAFAAQPKQSICAGVIEPRDLIAARFEPIIVGPSHAPNAECTELAADSTHLSLQHRRALAARGKPAPSSLKI